MLVKHGPLTNTISNFSKDSINSVSKKILHIAWEDRRTNISVLDEAKITSVEAMILQHQLRWTGHVVWMPDYRLPKQLLYSELKNGKCNVGGQRKRFKDKANLFKCSIYTDNWETPAGEHSSWRTAFTKGVMDFEDTQTQNAREKCARRKARLANPHCDQLPPGNQCPHCGRTRGSRIGLHSPLQTHC
ncbi:Hypothetical predicted protein [Podarcis lilfordi]|uniref:Uncharacterized protein n=1 Tax=Podarcis lilfordi TaxID=74358 RepID=A0AA35LHV3_9SAUR|nr:Hypothetical predicted protein [Podarcis lilfordi]